MPNVDFRYGETWKITDDALLACEVVSTYQLPCTTRVDWLRRCEMNIQMAAFAFGGLLLLIGVVGGGFEVKELKVPKVGTGVRVLSVLIGVLFIGLGFGSTPSDPQPGPSTVHADTAQDEPVDFVLTDQLGEYELSEQVTILIDGKEVGNLTVNQEYPTSRLMVTVPKRGQHSYTADAVAVFNDQGNPVQHEGAGQGMIDVQQGKIYAVVGSTTGDTWLVSIQEQLQ